MRRIIGLIGGMAALLACGAPAVAAGTDLIAIRPGIVCVSADALAGLTLPDGDSRTHAPYPRPEDLETARAGHCADIRLGDVVSVQAAHRDISVVTAPDATGPLVIANVDLQPLTDPSPPVHDGMVRAQHVAIGTADGAALEVLEDARITPALRRRMWGVAEDPNFVLDPGDPLLPGFKAHPLRPARLLLVNGHGTVLQAMRLTEPQAVVWPAPLRGLPAPGFMLTVDDSIGAGSYAGRVTTLLLPSLHRLDPARAVAADGTAGTIVLGDTLKTGWTIVRSGSGPTDDIELVGCRPVGSKPGFVSTYSTYRLADGRWHVASRYTPGIWEDGTFPGRSSFP